MSYDMLATPARPVEIQLVQPVLGPILGGAHGPGCLETGWTPQCGNTLGEVGNKPNSIQIILCLFFN